MSSSFRRACSAKAFVVALTLAVPAVVGPLVRVGAAAGDAATISEPDAPALSFREFFKMPVGPRGLEPTDKLLRASGISVCVCEPDRQSTPRHESSRGTMVLGSTLFLCRSSYLTALFICSRVMSVFSLSLPGESLCSKSGVKPLSLTDAHPGQAPTRTISLPKLPSSSVPMNASGALSRPSTRSSRWRMRPSAMPAQTSRRNVRLTSGRGGPLGVPPTPGAK